MWIDSHAHLQDAPFDQDRKDVYRRALNAGVREIILATSDLEDSKNALEHVSSRKRNALPRLYCSVGYHPHEAKSWSMQSYFELGDMIELDRNRVAQKGGYPYIVAVGEIGLDYHYMLSSKKEQENVFRLQIELAADYDLPIIIHSRDAREATRKILQQSYDDGQLKRSWGEIGVVHCYSYDSEELQYYLDMGFMIGFDGPITFKNGEQAREALAATPLDRLLLETDAPYLTPEPKRGKRNESANIPLIGKKAAEIKGIDVEELARQTSANARRLFRLAEIY